MTGAAPTVTPVNTPTRDRIILELFLTNNKRLIRNVAAQDTPLSDHRVVFINRLTDLKSQSPTSPIPTFEDITFRSPNIYKADSIKMNSILSEIDWDLLRDQCHADPDGNLFVELFRLTVLQVCCICSPKKLSDQKSAAHSAEQKHQEMRAVAKVLVNPKFFFSYAKKHSKVKCNVKSLSKSETLTDNPSEMADLLQEHYVSVFSNPAAEKQLPYHDGFNAGPQIGDITFSQADIEEAIDDMNRDAS